jgi:hypothetical protein
MNGHKEILFEEHICAFLENVHEYKMLTKDDFAFKKEYRYHALTGERIDLMIWLKKMTAEARCSACELSVMKNL